MLSDEDKVRIGEFKDMMVPIMSVATSIFVTFFAILIPITLSIVVVLYAIKYFILQN